MEISIVLFIGHTIKHNPALITIENNEDDIKYIVIPIVIEYV